jgi:hypothetical protein
MAFTTDVFIQFLPFSRRSRRMLFAPKQYEGLPLLSNG